MEDFITRVKQSKEKAIQSGSIISLRKESITKQQVVGQNYKISYTWYQTPAKVGVEIPYTVENRDDLTVKFDDDKFTIDFPIKNGGHYHLDIVLFSRIIPAKSKKNHKLHSIEIVMEKKNPSESWLFLRRDGLGVSEGGAEEEQKTLYPSSSKVKKNWDKIDKEIEGDILKSREQYGIDPGMHFFQEIYKNADPNKRKAMMKSFQTSDGTVLSTDWSDISKKDFEGKDRPSPPKGQEWRKRQI